MALAAAVWRTRSGIRRTSATDTLSVDVEAYTNLNPAGEGGVDRVEFYVSVNGGAATTHTKSAPEWRTPNYSNYTAPFPGIKAGMVPTWMYGITLACSGAATGGDQTVGYGTIEVTASVFSVAGTETPLVGSVVLYNDADGTDRRPSSVVRYVDETGNDAWDGTSATFVGGSVGPKATIASAMGTGECGGKVIHCNGSIGWFGSLGGTVFTSGHHWCTIQMAPGAVLRRSTTVSTTFATSVSQRFRLRINGGEVRGLYLDVTNGAGSNGMVWWDGTYHHSEYYTPERPSTIFYAGAEAVGGQFGVLFSASNDANWQQYASCGGVVGLFKGFANMGDVHDCEVAHILAEGFVSNNSVDGNGHSFCNVYYHDQVAGTGQIRGWFNSLVGTGDITISTAGLPAGQAKLSQTGAMYVNVFGSDDLLAPVDIEFTGSELVGLGTEWRIHLASFANAGNNGDFPVVGSGNDGNPYLIITNASAVAGVQNTGAITTTRWNGSSWATIDPHGDIWHGGGTHTNGVLSNLVTENVWHVQSFFAEGGFGCELHRFAIVNWAMSSPYASGDFAISWTGPSEDVTVLGCTWDCQGTIGGTQTRLCIVDCVLRGVTITAGTSPYIDNNHFMSGTTYGTNITSGTWWTTRPIDNGWSYEPNSGNLDTASGSWRRPEERWWDGATADTRGCDIGPGLQTWAITEGGGVDPPAGGLLPVMSLQFWGYAASYSAPVTPSNTVALDEPCNGFYCADGGTVSVRLLNNVDLSLVCPAGVFLPIRVVRFNATGTTVLSIHAVY